MLDSRALLHPEDENELVADIKRWLCTYCATRIDFELAEKRKCFSPDVVLDFGNKGLFGLTVPRSDGGMGLSHRAFGEIIMQLGAIDSTLCLFVGLSNVLGIRPLENYGQPGMREHYLGDLARGRLLGAFAMTEPAAGSAPQAMQTTARWHEGAYQINGTKHMIGNASWAGVIYVFARTIGEDGTFKGITGFAVNRNAKGLRIGPEAKTMGMRATSQSTIKFDGVRVTTDKILGEIGDGLEVAQQTMMQGRLVIAAAAIGGIKRCAVLAERYASRRSIATGKLADHPVTKRKLNDLVCRAQVVEHFVSPVLDGQDKGISAPPAILAACKIAASELLGEAADELVQILGGRGYMEPNVAPRMMRDARILRIFEGPTETLLAYLGSVADRFPESIQTYMEQVFDTTGPFEGAMEDFRIVKANVAQSMSHISSIDRRFLVRDFGGRLLIYALLACAQPTTSFARYWLQLRYQSVLSEIKREIGTAERSPEELRGAITDFRLEIGDFDPLEIGEATGIDPFLLKEWVSYERENEEI